MTLKLSRPAPPIDPYRGADSAVGVVVEPLRRPEDSQQAVADELVDVSAVVGDDRHHGLKEPVDRSHDLLCVGPRGESREVACVAKQQRHVGLEALRQVLVAEDVLGDLFVEVGAEGLADPLALGESGDHLVERSGQLAQLVGGGNRDGDVVVAAADRLDASLQVADRVHDRPRQQERQLQSNRCGNTGRDQYVDAEARATPVTSR